MPSQALLLPDSRWAQLSFRDVVQLLKDYNSVSVPLSAGSNDPVYNTNVGHTHIGMTDLDKVVSSTSQSRPAVHTPSLTCEYLVHTPCLHVMMYMPPRYTQTLLDPCSRYGVVAAAYIHVS